MLFGTLPKENRGPFVGLYSETTLAQFSFLMFGPLPKGFPLSRATNGKFTTTGFAQSEVMAHVTVRIRAGWPKATAAHFCPIAGGLGRSQHPKFRPTGFGPGFSVGRP